MGNLVVSDNAATTLAAPISNSPAVSSLVLATGTKFPTINNGGTGSDWSYVTLFDALGNIETVKVTRHDAGSNNLTILRGTATGIAGVTDATCLAWASGSTGVACRLIAQTVNDMFAAMNVASAAASSAAADASAAAASAAASVPLSQKAAAGGVPSLDANSKVVQTALKADAATTLATTGFVVEQSGSDLIIRFGATRILKIDSAGNLTVKANITGYGTP